MQFDKYVSVCLSEQEQWKNGNKRKADKARRELSLKERVSLRSQSRQI